MILDRHITFRLTQALEESPVVALLGARQVGKTTLAQHTHLGDRHYLSLDNPASRRQPSATRSPS
jgi:predicted AAA+ superfamily ATPase